MKIRCARIAGPPDHGLAPREVRALLRAMPGEWRAEVADVHLLADLPPTMWASSPRRDWVGLANAGLFSKILRIRSRGAARDDSARAALHAMAAACGHLDARKRFPCLLTRPERRTLGELVQPYMERFLSVLEETSSHEASPAPRDRS